MTLRQWQARTRAMLVVVGNVTVAYSHDAGLWGLDDYTVTADACGVVWLSPR